jgi:hypothetical protein
MYGLYIVIMGKKWQLERTSGMMMKREKKKGGRV